MSRSGFQLHEPIARAALNIRPAAIGSVLGLTAWSGHLAGLGVMPLLIYLWGKAGSRTRAFYLLFGYYLAAGHGLITGAGVFFGESAPLPPPIPGLLLWAGYSAILAVAWGVSWGTAYQPLRLTLTLISISVPPLGLVGGFNPMLSVGVLFPGLGWIGLTLTLMLFYILISATKKHIIALPFALISAYSNAVYKHPALPGWTALNTTFGPAATPESQFSRLTSLQRSVSSWSNKAAPGSVLVLPELVGDDWSLNGLWWHRIDQKLKQNKQTIFIGAYVPIGDGAMYENVVASLGFQAGRHLPDRVPVPISMWKPWTRAGAVNHWWDKGVEKIAGKRVASLVCYEQLLMWPVILSLTKSPEVILAPANDWWATNTNLPEIQRQSVQAWSRAFSVPNIWATNR